MRVSIDRVVVRGLPDRLDPGAFAGELRCELRRALGAARGGSGRTVEALRVGLPAGSPPAAGIAEVLGRAIGGGQ